jgi:hypothetical protein
MLMQTGSEGGHVQRTFARAAAGVLAAADIYFVARRRISPIYLVDAALELALLAAHSSVSNGAGAGPCNGSSGNG